MKRLFALLLASSLLLCSCLKVKEKEPSDSTVPTQTVVDDTAKETDSEIPEASEDTDPVDTEPEIDLPCLIGLYDELGDPGTYTRLTEWNDPWVMGKDIAVFDIIPSSEVTLKDPSFQNLWKAESNKISPDSLVKPYILLEYTLADGEKETYTITSWKEADEVISKGYLEVYLYDDIHQDGGWYSHLTAADTDESTVISSVKLTAGKNIATVTLIEISVCIEGSAPATVTVQNGK